MKYNEFVEFDPIESIVQLETSKDEKVAINLVKTFVISKRIAEQINTLMIPHIQFDDPYDNKGILIVGNYGTGKSHLMSVISAIAEFPESLKYINNDSLAQNAAKISGKFKVDRIEIGSTQMSLRDILFIEIENYLSSIGIKYKFPDADQVTNNKDSIIEMMDKFHQVYPSQGLLIVVDEILDYLRSRKEQELVLDLSFLREIGEACKLTKLRFIGGLQEMLFGNPRFQFVAESLLRVKDRFEQTSIEREDIAYVVSKRLLKKTDNQKGLIRAHLNKFKPLYKDMNERFEEYVDLFPVHPVYLEVFQDIFIAEKREVLKTISKSINKIINTDLPLNEPGLITYDSYWPFIEDNPSLKTIPEVSKVIEKSKILKSRINNAFPKKLTKPTAIKIINALSVQRLTTGRDIYSPIGVSAAELRDGLCIYLEMPENESEFLKTSIEAVLKDIINTVSGQFISNNPENGQYYLDLEKTIDYEARIEQKAETLSSSQIDQYYFNILKQVMECSDDTYVTGYKIWEHEIEWLEKKVTRNGYLFFGAPNQRSTAQPPRDFYIYLLPHYDPVRFSDGKRPDEVFFKLSKIDENFDKNIKMYSAALEEALVASAGDKQAYKTRSDKYQQSITKWLRENFSNAYDIIYKGVSRKPTDIIKSSIKSKDSVRDVVNNISAICFESHFHDLSPEYPKFKVLITSETIDKYAAEAIRNIPLKQRTSNSIAILEGLELLDGDQIDVLNSKYAKSILDALDQKGFGQVLNWDEIFTIDNGIKYEKIYRLEPAWVAILLIALLYNGNVEITLPGKKLDAQNLDEVVSVPINMLSDFKYIKKPSGIPYQTLYELFDFLGIHKALLNNASSLEKAVDEMNDIARKRIDEVLTINEKIKNGLNYGGISIINESDCSEYKRQLNILKEFFEYIKSINSKAKLNTFKYTIVEVKSKKECMDILDEVKNLLDFIHEIDPQLSYLSKASLILPVDNEWVKNYNSSIIDILKIVSNKEERIKPDFRRNILNQLNELKNDYINQYMEQHNKLRLDVSGDQRATRLKSDARLKRLRALRAIDILHGSNFDTLQNRLMNIKTCFAITKESLNERVVCPYCDFIPKDESSVKSVRSELDRIDNDIGTLESEWTGFLISNLKDDPSVQTTINLLKPDQQTIIKMFIISKELPENISSEFIKALQEAFSGINKLPINPSELIKELSNNGVPCTIDEFKYMFDEYIKGKTQGKDKNKLRIVLE